MGSISNLIPNRTQRFDAALRRWAKYDTRTGERINVKADGTPYKRVAFELAKPKRFELRLGLREARRRQAQKTVDATALHGLVRMHRGVALERWEKVRGKERNSVAVFADGSRIYFNRNGEALHYPR